MRGKRVIGEIDHASATMLVHEGAIYIHEGQSYVVNKLDLEENLATVVPTRVDYYTEVTSETKIDVLSEQESRADPHVQIAHGELLVSSRPVGYRRIKRFTHETLGVFPLEYEPAEVETNGYWFGILPEAQMKLARGRAVVRLGEQLRGQLAGAASASASPRRLSLRPMRRSRASESASTTCIT